MNSAPFFSVIIPVYNSSGYVRQTLASLSAQAFKDFEVIIVDDNSTDGSADICRKAMAEDNLKGTIIQKPPDIPRGVSNSRNLGITNAQSEWVTFLDSDDLFMPEKLSRIYKLIEEYGDDSQAYFNGVRTFEDGSDKTLSVSVVDIKQNEPADILPQLLRGNFITTSSVTVKKTLLTELNGFDGRLHIAEDYMLWLRIAKQTKWVYDGEQLTDYRLRKESLMNGRDMAYYVTQAQELIKTAKGYPEFSAEDIALIDDYLFAGNMPYYAGLSLQNKGWGDFMKGLAALRKADKASLATLLLRRHIRFFSLRIASQAYRKLVNKNNQVVA